MEYFERSFLTLDNLNDFFNDVCKKYDIGEYQEYKVVEIGYEDLNIILTTTTGQYLIKVLTKDRSKENALWYTEVQKKAYEGMGDSTVSVYANTDGEHLSENNTEEGDVYYNLLSYFKSQNLYENEKDITIDNVVSLAFDVMSFGYKTPALKRYLETEGETAKMYDPWSFENLVTEYNKKKQYLSEEQKSLVLPFVEFWNKVIEADDPDFEKNHPNLGYYVELRKKMIAELRRTPIQRDFISTNILTDGKDFKLIDHSITGITFDFVDLAVFGCDAAMIKGMTDLEYIEILKILGYIYYKSTEQLGENFKAYASFMQLVGIQHSLHIINAEYLKQEEGLDDPQNQYWIDLGMRGAKAIIDSGYHEKAYPSTPFRGPKNMGLIMQRYNANMQRLLEEKGISDLVNNKIKEFSTYIKENDVKATGRKSS